MLHAVFSRLPLHPMLSSRSTNSRETQFVPKATVNLVRGLINKHLCLFLLANLWNETMALFEYLPSGCNDRPACAMQTITVLNWLRATLLKKHHLYKSFQINGRRHFEATHPSVWSSVGSSSAIPIAIGYRLNDRTAKPRDELCRRQKLYIDSW